MRDESLPALTIQELPDTSNIRIEGNPPGVLSVTYLPVAPMMPGSI